MIQDFCIHEQFVFDAVAPRIRNKISWGCSIYHPGILTVVEIISLQPMYTVVVFILLWSTYFFYYGIIATIFSATKKGGDSFIQIF
jgi:hypothetical protein